MSLLLSALSFEPFAFSYFRIKSANSVEDRSMSPLNELGKFLLIAGIFMVVAGLALVFLDKIPFLGKLPGDIVVRKGNFTFYFPLATSIILSIVLTIIFSIFRK